jgi:L-ascorbate metabolism protein UlaG (beta-lactamase superfamily)
MIASRDQGELGGRRLLRIRFLGHATVAIELDGTKLLTDPVLRGRISALMRCSSLPRDASTDPVDAVLISHMHHDHLDVPSLRRLGPDMRLLVPRRAGAFLARRGFRDAREMRAGEAVEIGTVRVVATPASHIGFRGPFGPHGGCLGFIVEGSARVYFAGDTNLFPEMAALGPVDVALLPIAGWGPILGPGHLDPLEAARTLRLIRPKIAIPIHWGTFAPIGIHLRHWPYLVNPPLDFAAHARQIAPEVEVLVLEPGESVDLDLPIDRTPPGGLSGDGGSRSESATEESAPP